MFAVKPNSVYVFMACILCSEMYLYPIRYVEKMTRIIIQYNTIRVYYHGLTSVEASVNQKLWVRHKPNKLLLEWTHPAFMCKFSVP